MATITVEITDTQLKGLQYAAFDPQEWATTTITERARVANDEIVNITVQHCLDNNITMPSSREELVTYAFENDLVKTAAQREAEHLASAQLQEAEAVVSGDEVAA